jgi:hypothetical protein
MSDEADISLKPTELPAAEDGRPESVQPDSSHEEDTEPVIEIELVGTGRPLSEAARGLIEQGRARFKSVDVFAFVPSNYEVFWDKLDALPRGRFCEYGSGWGIATGLAELLGFEALGIELAPELVSASQKLLADQGLRACIEEGDYLERRDVADVYFTYAWPSQMRAIEQHFADIAPPGSKLLICHGQDDIRCKTARNSRAI